MKLYYFKTASCNIEYTVIAENKIKAHEYLLIHIENRITEYLNNYSDLSAIYYRKLLEKWENVDPLDISTFPYTYSLEEYDIGQVIETEVS
jgi:hypothetical protein